MLPAANLIGLASALPDRILGNDYFEGARESVQTAGQRRMFQGTKYRRHLRREESAVDLFERGANAIRDDLGSDALQSVDAILTNVSLPDQVFTGCGAMVAKRLGLEPRTVIDLHNGGCVSFVIMLDLARTLVQLQGLRRVLVCVAQTAAGRIFGQEAVRKKPQAAVPGDGGAVALVGADPGIAMIEGVVQKCYPAFSEDMSITFDDNRLYWEPGVIPGYLDFRESKISTIIIRGNRIVPEIMYELCEHLSLKASDFTSLVTNQPNHFFLRNWREALQIPEDRHFDTFEKYGNLFQAGIPISLDEAVRDGKINKSERVMLAGFSHAGDYTAAASLMF